MLLMFYMEIWAVKEHDGDVLIIDDGDDLNFVNDTVVDVLIKISLFRENWSRIETFLFNGLVIEEIIMSYALLFVVWRSGVVMANEVIVSSI